MPRFWRLDCPDYDSDYRQARENGSLEHPCSMPGVECSKCHETWGSSRVLPIACPEEMRDHPNILSRWPVSDTDFRALQSKMLDLLRMQGHHVDHLKPGDSFQPAYLTIPSKPTADFLWASVGSVTVSERIKVAFEEHQFLGVQFCPVVMKNATDGAGPYFEMLVTGESGLPVGVRPPRICSACGYPKQILRKRRFVMTDEMWPKQDIFFLSGTPIIIVTDGVKTLLEQMGGTNVRIEDATVEKPSIMDLF